MQINILDEKLTENTCDDTKYYCMDLKLMESDFREFCKTYMIDYQAALKIGIQQSKILLKRYRNDELDGSVSKYECENLYKLVKDPWGCSKLVRHQILTEIIARESSKLNLNIKKILIIGGGLGGEFRCLTQYFPHAVYYITDIFTSI